MKHISSVFLWALIVGWLSMAATQAVAATATQPAGPAPATQPAGGIDMINQAPDPSAVVTAYVGALAADRQDIRVHVAYVHRMVELGLPEMAYHQALLTTGMDPLADGVSWGVLAFVQAKQGQMDGALASLTVAVRLAPDQPFVQRSAGELLAWYDIKKPPVVDSLKASIENIRKQLAGQAAYMATYKTAGATLEASAAPTPASQPASPQTLLPQDMMPGVGDLLSTGYDAPPTQYVYPETNTYIYPQTTVYDTSGPFLDWWWPGGAFFGPTFIGDRDDRGLFRHMGRHQHDSVTTFSNGVPVTTTHLTADPVTSSAVRARTNGTMGTANPSILTGRTGAAVAGSGVAVTANPTARRGDGNGTRILNPSAVSTPVTARGASTGGRRVISGGTSFSTGGRAISSSGGFRGGNTSFSTSGRAISSGGFSGGGASFSTGGSVRGGGAGLSGARSFNGGGVAHVSGGGGHGGGRR